MKVRYINDVPSNIKTIAFYGDYEQKEIQKTKENISHIKWWIDFLVNKESRTEAENDKLIEYNEKLKSQKKYLQSLLEIEEAEKNLTKNKYINNDKSNVLILLIPVFILYALIKRKK